MWRLAWNMGNPARTLEQSGGGEMPVPFGKPPIKKPNLAPIPASITAALRTRSGFRDGLGLGVVGVFRRGSGTSQLAFVLPTARVKFAGSTVNDGT